MLKETLLRSIFERILPSTIASFELRPIAVSAHQALAELYNAVDGCSAAVNRNQHATARHAAEKLLVETFRTLVAYEMPTAPEGVDKVEVETRAANSKAKVTRR